MLNQLRQDNDRLRRQHQVESQQIAEQRLALLVQLEKQVDGGADDTALVHTINQIKEICGKTMKIGQCHLDELISPSVVEHLVAKGFFEDEASANSMLKKCSMKDLVTKVKKRNYPHQRSTAHIRFAYGRVQTESINNSQRKSRAQ